MNGEKIEKNGGAPDEVSTQKKRVTTRRVSKTKAEKAEDRVAPLKVAADRIATLLCELSADSTLFVTTSGEAPSRRLDTKALKEFSGVLKEMSAVMTELHGEQEAEKHDGVLIEFSGDVSDLGV